MRCQECGRTDVVLDVCDWCGEEMCDECIAECDCDDAEDDDDDERDFLD
jgi:hypothetical protein